MVIMEDLEEMNIAYGSDEGDAMLRKYDGIYRVQYDDLFIYDLTNKSKFLMEFSSVNNFQAASLLFSFFLYAIGLLGMIFNYKNFLVTMMSVELMYLGAITSFVLNGTATNDPRGSIYALFFLVLAACESAIGLGIIIVLYRFGRSIDFASYQELGG